MTSPSDPPSKPAATANPSLALLAALLVAAAGCSSPEPAGGADAGGGRDIPVLKVPDGKKGIDLGGGLPNRPPVLKRVGDRQLVVDEPVSIVLEAFDPDGDPLSFAVFGDLPEGAKFDGQEGRFDWTPKKAEGAIFLTFQVTDGSASDRETVRLTVSTTRENLPPAFPKIGDQKVEAGSEIRLDLQATDPNDDPLLYGVNGPLPPGAALAPKTGVFIWSVPSDLAGTVVRVLFTVSDGDLGDSLNLKFVVGHSGGGPSPPELAPLGPFEAEVGVALAFTVKATDADGDDIHYGVDGDLPTGASFDGKTGAFAWTPGVEAAGTTTILQFSASDGTFTAFAEVKISVFLPGPAGSCSDDPGELNDSAGDATPLDPGTHEGLSICDSEQNPLDSDWYRINVPASQELHAVLTWPMGGQPLDIRLAVAGPDGTKIVATGEGPPGQREATYAPGSDGGEVLVNVVGTDFAKYAQGYTLQIDLNAAAPECQKDDQENASGNDSAATATPISLPAEGALTLGDLGICPADEDWFLLQLQCGDAIDARIVFDATQLDLDLYLYAQADPDKPLSQSASLGSPETVDLFPVPATSGYLVRVTPAQPSAAGPYTLEVTAFADLKCQDDASEPDDSPDTATPIAPGQPLPNQRICCSDDFYGVGVSAGDTLTVRVNFSSGSGTADLFFGAGGSALATESGKDITILWTAESDGIAHVRVRGASVDVGYGISVSIEAGGGACTSLSCPLYEVCDSSTGKCVSDYCSLPEDCPAEFKCIDTFCVNPCAQDADCRTDAGYTCKSFPEGRYCGPAGSGAIGSGCYFFMTCGSSSACLFTDSGGYCAPVGCATTEDCPPGSACATSAGLAFCGKPCASDDTCRTDDGQSCKALSSPGGGDASVCAP